MEFAQGRPFVMLTVGMKIDILETEKKAGKGERKMEKILPSSGSAENQ